MGGQAGTCRRQALVDDDAVKLLGRYQVALGRDERQPVAHLGRHADAVSDEHGRARHLRDA